MRLMVNPLHCPGLTHDQSVKLRDLIGKTTSAKLQFFSAQDSWPRDCHSFAVIEEAAKSTIDELEAYITLITVTGK